MASTKHRRTAPQGSDLYKGIVLVNQLSTLGAELATDHATTKVTVDELETLVEELGADHATFKTVVDDLKTLVNNMRTYLAGDRLFSGNPALAIDTNFDVQAAAACVVSIDGVLKSVAATTTCDTGTTATFPQGTWGIFLVSCDDTDSLNATWDDNSQAGHASEAAAIAALPAAPASQAPVGYVTVQAHASNSFTAGTDALQGGTGGNASPDTNYYNLADPASTISAAVSSSAPATLSASTAITSGPATLTAAGTSGDQVLDPGGTAFS